MNPRLLLVAALVAAPTARADHDQIDKQFADAAPRILKTLKGQKAENVGVLKFRVQKGDGPPTDSAGELNMGLANRLEAALILALDPEDTFGILGRPSPIVAAEKNEAANHLTAAGRSAFFEGRYPLAWKSRTNKDEWISPTAFVVGTAKIAIVKGKAEVTVALQSFGPDGKLTDLDKPFTVPASRRTLVEAGYSYVLTKETAPEQFDDGARGGKIKAEGVSQYKKPDEDATLKDLIVRNDPTRPDAGPAAVATSLAGSPVKLTVLYGDKEVPIEGDKMREPKEGEKVTFRLENTDPSPDVFYAVVLKVNGKNTIFSEDAEAAYCLKWILAKGQKLDIKGFQTDNDNYDEFVIKSDTESAVEAVRYGDLAGTVRMVVFRGRVVTEDPSIVEKKNVPTELLTLNAVARGANGIPTIDGRPGSLSELQAGLKGRETEADGARGMMVKGNQTRKGKIEKIFFQSLPTVGVADVTLHYYAPKK